MVDHDVIAALDGSAKTADEIGESPACKVYKDHQIVAALARLETSREVDLIHQIESAKQYILSKSGATRLKVLKDVADDPVKAAVIRALGAFPPHASVSLEDVASSPYCERYTTAMVRDGLGRLVSQGLGGVIGGSSTAIRYSLLRDGLEKLEELRSADAAAVEARLAVGGWYPIFNREICEALETLGTADWPSLTEATPSPAISFAHVNSLVRNGFVLYDDKTPSRTYSLSDPGRKWLKALRDQESRAAADAGKDPAIDVGEHADDKRRICEGLETLGTTTWCGLSNSVEPILTPYFKIRDLVRDGFVLYDPAPDMPTYGLSDKGRAWLKALRDRDKGGTRPSGDVAERSGPTWHADKSRKAQRPTWDEGAAESESPRDPVDLSKVVDWRSYVLNGYRGNEFIANRILRVLGHGGEYHGEDSLRKQLDRVGVGLGHVRLELQSMSKAGLVRDRVDGALSFNPDWWKHVREDPSLADAPEKVFTRIDAALACHPGDRGIARSILTAIADDGSTTVLSTLIDQISGLDWPCRDGVMTEIRILVSRGILKVIGNYLIRFNPTWMLVGTLKDVPAWKLNEPSEDGGTRPIAASDPGPAPEETANRVPIGSPTPWGRREGPGGGYDSLVVAAHKAIRHDSQRLVSQYFNTQTSNEGGEAMNETTEARMEKLRNAIVISGRYSHHVAAVVSAYADDPEFMEAYARLRDSWGDHEISDRNEIRRVKRARWASRRDAVLGFSWNVVKYASLAGTAGYVGRAVYQDLAARILGG